MKKVLDNSSGFFQLLKYSALPLPSSTPASSHPPSQHPTSPSNQSPVPNPLEYLADGGGAQLSLSRTNSNSSEPSSPPPPPSSPNPQSSQLLARLSTELSSCVSSISSGNAQCRSMLPILHEFIVHGDVCVNLPSCSFFCFSFCLSTSSF